jgi:Na+/proline symporter
MNIETLQKAWQSQDASAKVTINTDVLLNEVRRNQQQFRATIFWRDVREVGVAFLLTLYFSYRGLRHNDWTDCLVGFACFGVGTFMVVDRLLQRKKQPVSNDSLKTCIKSSLLQVNHQIWLLKNVFWWYLLPIAAALGISICYSTWHTRNSGFPAVIIWVISALLIVLVYWGIYWLNQFAVRKCLEPRRQELETLLTSLNEN